SAGVALALEELLPDLGASLQEVAREAARRAARLQAGDAGVLAPYADPLPGEMAVHDARAQREAVVIALPCTAPALALLTRLVRAAPDAVHVMRTPLTERFAGAVTGGPLRLATPAEMVKIVRGGWAATSPPLLITFPDHQPAATGTAWGVRFFGQVHAFATLEPILLARGARGLFGVGAGPAVVQADPSVLGGGIQALLEWLALRMEEALRSAPAEALSWELIQRRALRAMLEREALRRTLVADLIRAWHSAHPTAPRELVAAALGSLRTLPELPAALAGGLR
ncbi:MAG TPA: hypothetical protein VK420_05785, partial [Longimicrobium sp.]|nr:hypothetical protein [Longimicrobium sp.]